MDKGLKLLFATYWDGGIWKHKAATAEDYKQAIEEGYMFGAAPIRTHDETLRDLRDILERISPGDVANAFLYSLSTRQLQYRSALGSYYYALAVPNHSHDAPITCCFVTGSL